MLALCVPLLTACLDRPWDGPTEDRIDRATDEVDFDSVGGIVCDHREHGTILGGVAYRVFGIEGADNLDALVEAFEDAGYTEKNPDSPDRDRFLSFYSSSGRRTFGLTVITDTSRTYNTEKCPVGPDGVIRVQVY